MTTGSLGVGVIAVTAVLVSIAAPAEAQTVLGTVLDARTNQPVATARVTLLDARDEHVETTLTNVEGSFVLRARAPGEHVLELDRLGYHAWRTESFEVVGEGVTRQDVRLEPEAIELEGITAEVYAGQLLHDATLSGVYARRARSPSVGGNRVLVRGQDPDFETPQVIADMLPGWMKFRPRCQRLGGGGPIVFVDGWEADGSRWTARQVLNSLPVREVVAIEYYRDLALTPMALRPSETDRRAFDFKIVQACGLLAVWTRGAPR